MKKGNKVVGTATYINETTGELKEMQVVETDVYEKDSNFHKLFLNKYLTALEAIADKKVLLFCWIIRNMNSKNQLLYSYREISDKANVSYGTVTETMKILQNKDFIRRKGSRCYIINPNIIFKGTFQRRCAVFREYSEVCRTESLGADEKRLESIRKDIARLRREEEKIQRKLDIHSSPILPQ